MILRFLLYSTLLVAVGSNAAGVKVAELSAATYTLAPGTNVQFELQNRFIRAVPGDVIELREGRYSFESELSLVADNITLRGAGPDKTILSFRGQRAGSHGIEATGDNFVIEGLAVEDTAGTAIKVLGATNVIFRNVRAEWTGKPSSENGAYGIYPVQCHGVLIEDCFVRGASDAGIYVGQSHEVIVRRCRAEGNVAGIEIENTIHADVFDNVATNNAGGLLVFDLPGLQVVNGGTVRVFKNRVVGNNHWNFATPGSSVSEVSPGTGLMIMAADRVEVFENDLADNQTVNLLLISYLTTGHELKPKHAAYDPYPESISIHHNRFARGGQNPSGGLGALLRAPLGVPFPDVLWDGFVDQRKLEGGRLPEAWGIRFADNGAMSFANFRLAALSPESLKEGKYRPEREIQPYAGTFASLVPVTLALHRKPSPAGDMAVLTYRSAPKRISEYGLFAGKLSEQRPAEGVLQYDLNTALFSDYTTKHRFVRLPKGATINYQDRGVFSFPIGTVIAKTFAMPRDMRDPTRGERLLETRIELHKESGWYGFAYLWNEEQTEAFLVLGGDVVETSWVNKEGERVSNHYRVPNANQCLSCHEQDGRFVPLGPTASNLNREFDYASGHENQLAHWEKQGALRALPQLAAVPKMPVFDDPNTGTVEHRARAWLELNCAHCHQPSGSARTTGLDLRLSQTDPARFGVGKKPVAAGRATGGRKYDIVPGKPDESILLYRVSSVEPGVLMPSLSRNLVHPESVALLRQWIAEMPAPGTNPPKGK